MKSRDISTPSNTAMIKDIENIIKNSKNVLIEGDSIKTFHYLFIFFCVVKGRGDGDRACGAAENLLLISISICTKNCS